MLLAAPKRAAPLKTNAPSLPTLPRRNIGYTLAAVLAFVGIPSVCVLYGGSNAAKALGLSWQVRATAAPLSVKREEYINTSILLPPRRSPRQHPFCGA